MRYVNSLKNIDWDDIQAQYHSLVESIFKKVVNIENAYEIIEALPVVYRVFVLSNVCLRTNPKLIDKVFDIAIGYYVTASSKTQALVVARSLYYTVINCNKTCLDIMLKYFLKHVDGNLSKQIVTYIFDDIIHGHPKNVDIVCFEMVRRIFRFGPTYLTII